MGLFLESLICFEGGYLLVELIDRTLIFGLLFNLASLGVWLLRIRGPCQIERLGLRGLQGIDREARHHILSFEIHLPVVYLILLIHSLIRLLLQPLHSFGQALTLPFQSLNFSDLHLDIFLAFLELLLQLLGLIPHPLFFIPVLHGLVLVSLIGPVSLFLYFSGSLLQFLDMNLLNLAFLFDMPKLVV